MIVDRKNDSDFLEWFGSRSASSKIKFEFFQAVFVVVGVINALTCNGF